MYVLECVKSWANIFPLENSTIYLKSVPVYEKILNLSFDIFLLFLNFVFLESWASRFVGTQLCEHGRISLEISGRISYKISWVNFHNFWQRLLSPGDTEAKLVSMAGLDLGHFSVIWKKYSILGQYSIYLGQYFFFVTVFHKSRIMSQFWDHILVLG